MKPFERHSTRSPEKRTRRTMVRTATEHEPYAVTFDIRAFCQRHGLSQQAVAQAFDINSANFGNWHKDRDQVPLSFAKAVIEHFAHAETDAFEQAINGHITRRQRVYLITPKTKEQALKYDARRPGLRLRVKDGTVLETPIIPTKAADPLPEPTPITELAPLADVLSELAADADARRPARSPIMQSFEVPTPLGVMRMEMPQASETVTPGERELLTSLLIRTHYQLVATERAKAALDIRYQASEAQVESLRRRLQEVHAELKHTEELRVSGEKSQGATVAAITTPRVATERDVTAIKRTLNRVPDLVQLVDDMAKSMNGSFPKGAALIS